MPALSFGFDESLKEKDKEYWRSRLSADQFNVCREGGTERAYSGKYSDFHESGAFTCSSCGAELFSSENKFDSGTGWPSFTRPVNQEAVELLNDASMGIVRTEVRCSRCGAHLGHVFDDGPLPTRKRYCINSVCLNHKEKLEKAP